MLTSLKNREYRLLWSGQAISHLGDQFHLVALPWLVLAVTHDPMQLGLVLAAAGIPRAILMLFGGATADRFSPRTIMLVSDLLRFAISAALVVAIFGGSVQLWMIYALAIAFGTVSGFFLPAAEATIPRLLPSAQLEGGNSLMMIATQVAGFVGPALAGTTVALFSGAASATAAGMKGIGVAFAFDAITFLVSAATLWLMRSIPGLGSDKHPLHDIAEGFRFVVVSPMSRLLIVAIAIANFCMMGPLLVGVPVLASERLPQGAAAFGLIVSSYAFGNLFGMVGAGSLPRPSNKLFGLLASGLFLAFGLIFGSFGLVSSTWVAMALMAIAGVGNGYVAVLAISALQRLTPQQMLGRVMSLLMLAMVGLAPLSQAIAGAAVKVSLSGLFAAAGLGMLVTGVFVFTRRGVWQFPEEDEGALAAEVEPIAA
jgi:Major Facilitator Superfamily